MPNPRTEQQDVAAGGAAFRKVRLEDGGAATASVEIVTLPKKGYQEWAFLRFKTGGKTRKLYVGKVTSETREQSLALAWKLVHEKQVLEKAGLAWLTPVKAQATRSKAR